MLQAKGIEEIKPLDAIITRALSQTFPIGTKIDEMSFNDKVGTMILLKIVNHLAGPNLSPVINARMAILYAIIGASTGMLPNDRSTVSMLYRSN